MTSWDLGCYEVTARELGPVAVRVVSLANPLRSETVLDIGCGTGNAAILAARFGATVAGVDPAPRLLQVGRERAAAQKLDIFFVLGDACRLPLAESTFDVVLSVFGIVFAPDRQAAFSELLRVLKPGGRALLTAWIPSGAIAEMVSCFSRAISLATGTSMPVPPFEWHDPTAVRAVAIRHRATASFREAKLQITARSPEDYLDSSMRSHPISVATRPALEAAGLLEGVRTRALDILRSANEDPAGFSVTSPYRVIEIRR